MLIAQECVVVVLCMCGALGGATTAYGVGVVFRRSVCLCCMGSLAIFWLAQWAVGTIWQIVSHALGFVGPLHYCKTARLIDGGTDSFFEEVRAGCGGWRIAFAHLVTYLLSSCLRRQLSSGLPTEVDLDALKDPEERK